MGEHPDLEVFRQAYAAFTGGDMDTLGALFTDDIVWHTPGDNPLSGTYRGREATLASFAAEAELCGNTYQVGVHDVLAGDEHTVALLRATATRGNRRLDQNYVLVFHIDRGRVAEAWEVWTDQAAADAFWRG